jgi:hypothetical protein
MTTTQQPTQQPTRQPTGKGNNQAAGTKLCVKLCFFSVSRYFLTPGQCYASQTSKGTFFLDGKGMFLCFSVKQADRGFATDEVSFLTLIILVT